ncbi:tyrosine--tRNA ligase [Nocardiopsis sp. CNR-923]|uniref:tyrosine--tRNA ligase n=1 Tax=Nocardiopsis sp. CNR-923 TaxID=1904965 RepID=UPI00095B1AA2|nr:tyrosine--tRNA ligase [Nocardiopsis sp. CNR-923]OLT26295.1 tyrosine--tRNA ligase [Nocardiopsis sp. CNR-923]
MTATLTIRWLWLLPEARRALESRELAVILRCYRTLTGLSQAAMGELLGYDPSYVSLLERRQRTTAKIGDPSGRSGDRPALTDADIARNLATYRDQVAPFFDFTRADFRHNSSWLSEVRLPELIEILAQVPVSMSLQREDFRTRLEQGHGLSTAEFIYSVVMAINSVKIEADIELGGVDQLLNMQMGRKVMEITDQKPQLVATMPLIEGTDGTGKKMSKSMGNYIALSATPEDIFGKVMSIPDRLVSPYLRAWTEWSDAEIDAVNARVDKGTLHPMDLKKVLAGEAVAALHGVETAMSARAAFTAQYSRRAFGDIDTLPVVDTASTGETVGAVLARVLEFTPSVSAARRIAKQNGLRIVIETAGGQEAVILAEDDVQRPLSEAVDKALSSSGQPTEETEVYLKAGRKVARIERSTQ